MQLCASELSKLRRDMSLQKRVSASLQLWPAVESMGRSVGLRVGVVGLGIDDFLLTIFD